MKLILVFIFFISVFAVKGQDKGIVKYYDSLWKLASAEKAVYYTEYEKVGNYFKGTSYYKNSGNIYGRSLFTDTISYKRIGTMINYYETGSLKDSSIYDVKGTALKEYSFYKSGKLLKQSILNEHSYELKVDMFTENGKLIADSSFTQIPAEFQGGLPGWSNYLSEHLNSDIPTKKNAPDGKYTVVVTFIVDLKGNVIDVDAENDPGYGTKQEAIRVIRKSPKWQPAIKNGKPTIYRHRQSITFVVSK